MKFSIKGGLDFSNWKSETMAVKFIYASWSQFLQLEPRNIKFCNFCMYQYFSTPLKKWNYTTLDFSAPNLNFLVPLMPRILILQGLILVHFGLKQKGNSLESIYLSITLKSVSTLHLLEYLSLICQISSKTCLCFLLIPSIM